MRNRSLWFITKIKDRYNLCEKNIIVVDVRFLNKCQNKSNKVPRFLVKVRLSIINVVNAICDRFWTALYCHVPTKHYKLVYKLQLNLPQPNYPLTLFVSVLLSLIIIITNKLLNCSVFDNKIIISSNFPFWYGNYCYQAYWMRSVVLG